MPEKDSLLYQIFSQLGTITYIVFIGSIAGMVGYLNRLERSKTKFKWQMLIASVLTGGLNGYLMFLLCDVAGWNWQVTAFLTGAAGAMGSEGLRMLTNIATSRTNKLLNGD